MQALATWALDGLKSPPSVPKRLTLGPFGVPFWMIWGVFCLHFRGVGGIVCLRLLEDYVEYLMRFLGFDLSLSGPMSVSLSLSLFISLSLLPCSSCFPLSHSPSLRLMQLSFAYLLDCCVVEAARSAAEDHISLKQLCWLLGLSWQCLHSGR